MNTFNNDPRLVPFSMLYHKFLTDAVQGVVSEHSPEAAHDYDARVATVVVLGALFCEATVNEIIYWLEHHQNPLIGAAQINKKSIRDKWRTVALVGGGLGFDESCAPWQDFSALVDLRNALVHAHAYGVAEEALMQFLVSRRCTQEALDWFESAMTTRTARWVLSTVSAMPQRLRELLAPHLDLHNGGAAWFWDQDWFRGSV